MCSAGQRWTIWVVKRRVPNVLQEELFCSTLTVTQVSSIMIQSLAGRLAAFCLSMVNDSTIGFELTECNLSAFVETEVKRVLKS